MKRIAVVGVCMLMCFHLAGCMADNNPNESENGLIQRKADAGMDVETKNNIKQDEGSMDVEMEPQYAMKDNILEAGTEIVCDEIAYQVLETEITNQFGNRKKENLNDVALEYADGNGNLTGDNKYVFLKIRFTNKSSEEREILRNAGTLVLMKEDRRCFQASADVVYMDTLWTKGEKSSEYHYVLKPGESVESELAYAILPDHVFPAALSDDLFYMVGNSGELGSADNYYVKLEE